MYLGLDIGRQYVKMVSVEKTKIVLRSWMLVLG